MSEHIVEVNQENAQQVLIEESSQRPVLVDFWADWCEPCKNLMPVLEKLAIEYNGQFLLAKINADEQQGIAGQLGVRSLPTVMLFKDGQPVDGFAGVKPENEVRELLDKYLPRPWDMQLSQAQALIAEGNFVDALALLRPAYEDSSQQANIGLTLAQVYLELNRCDDAEAVLANVKMVDQDATYQQLMSQMELKREAAKSPEVQALEDELNQNPDNKDAAFKLAVQFSQTGQSREALELLLGLLRKELNYEDGAAKKVYQDILINLGKGDPLAVEFQRKLYTLLY